MSGENRRLGCFHLLDEVGRGSQGVVYKAICESDGFEGVSVGAIVALRVLSVDSGDKDYEAQFEKRIAELKGLSHPSVVKCLGSFCEKGPFGDMRVLVQEWFEGESLKERLRRNPNGIDADEALRIGGQLLDALAYISSKGVVLGSVQPDYITLCNDGSDKLADFEYPVQQSPCMPSVHPSLNYTAPEFLNAEFRGDERSDIFSFGVCFHEMLTGRLPYAAQSHTPTITEFFERWHGGDNAPIMIHPLVKRIMVGAAEALEKALRGKREERYATFADFAAAFKGIRCRELTHGDNTWRMLQYVGRGGFSEVFKARDVETGQVVAIKRLCRSQYEDRFRREARILSGLNEPSIVRFVDFFAKELDGRRELFLVMQYLDGMPGRSLWDELKRAGGKPLPRDLVIRAFARYAHGLSVLHNMGIIHRDIKPSNLYFPVEAIDHAAIMDLAIARDMHGTMTAGAVPGTLDYMPPEVVISESRGDVGMDIYALGLSLYEALSGTSAYPCLPTGVEGFRELFERAKNKARPSLDESAYSDLPDLVRLVREMTEPAVTKRLKDAAEVERRLCALTDKAFVQHDHPCPVYGCPKYRGARMLLGELWDEIMASISMRIRREESHMGKVQDPDVGRGGDWTLTSDPDTDDLVSETEDGTDGPSAFLNLHGNGEAV